MKVTTFPTYGNAVDAELIGRFVIVVDVLRATSTIVTAIEHGATAIVPVEEIEEAMDFYHARQDGLLLCGERGAQKIEGFHLSNSPLEFTRQAVAGKTLVMTTTNGTPAFRRAARGEIVVAAALINVRAVAEAAVRSGRDISIICAGTLGKYSLDDVLCAGAIIDVIMEEFAPALDDLSWHARYSWNAFRPQLSDVVMHSDPAQRLSKLGAYADIEYCLQRDIYQCVPVFQDGRIERM